jgi:hypothetical protein
MTVDKFGRHITGQERILKKHINSIKKENKKYIDISTENLSGYINLFLAGTFLDANSPRSSYNLHHGPETYSFPLEQGQIENVYLSVDELKILINDIPYTKLNLIGQKLYKNNIITIEYLEGVPKVFVELIVKYPIKA